MEREQKPWTDSQRAALEANEKTILVSAAAGSGKSTVLTERIIRHLMDEKYDVELDRIVVVTFTKAAAAELRDKIANGLTEALAHDPSNKRLTRQMLALNRAHISTIDSFCYDLIRSHFETLGLSSSVRIGESNECKLLKSEVMENVLEAHFDGLPGTEKIADFPTFYEYFVKGKSDSSEIKFLALYDALMKYPEGLSRLLTNAEKYEEAKHTDFFMTDWGKAAKAEISVQLSHFRRLYRLNIDALSALGGYEEKIPVFEEELSFIERFLFLLEQGDTSKLPDALNALAFENLAKGKHVPQSTEYNSMKAVRDSFKKLVTAMRRDPLFFPAEEIVQCADAGIVLLRDLYAFLTYFDARLTEEKRRRNLLDFTDIERLAYALLVRDVKPTETAKTVSAQFKEYYIDEYQDTNELQDAIFRAASVGSARFMVGDVKQSIYGFRGSVPELFSEYRKDPDVRTIFLQENFRSEKNILTFDNAIFDFLFRHASGRMPYDACDALVAGKKPGTSYPIEVSVVETPRASDTVPDAGPCEAEYVASRIREMIREGRNPGDITILLRSPSTSGKEFEDALEKAGVPYEMQEKHDLFENPQILLYLCLLNCIDNPRRDVYLAGLLRSPLYGFTLDDLVRIRGCSKGTLWDALKEYTAKTEDPKALYFTEKLSQYRKWAFSSPVDRLIWRIFEDTSAFSLTVGDGSDPETNREKLLRLYDYARQFENGSFKGLYQFIRYLNDIIDSGEKMPLEESPDEEKRVKIMSMHSSKGLQFKVCFVCKCGKGFNLEDLNEDLLYERMLGLAAKRNDESGLARLASPFHSATKMQIRTNLYDEEMRLLYVALTRAQEQLIITGASSNPDALLEDCMDVVGADDNDMSYLVSKSNGFLPWILRALRASGFTEYTEQVIRFDPAKGETEQKAPLSQKAEEPEDTALTELLRERFSFVYPFPSLSSLPAKLTVSRLKPDLLDPDEDGILDLTSPRAVDFAVPDFLKHTEITGAERGTATHLFMQFCDLNNAKENGIDAEIARLTEKQFITEETAGLIRKEHLVRFFDSDLYSRMRDAVSLRREVRFNVNMPASVLSEVGNFPGEELLVQGVIDCYFLGNDGTVTLLDYKTDSIPKELRGDSEKEDEFLRVRHSGQLRYYRIALEKILCRPIDRVILWSFALGREIEIP